MLFLLYTFTPKTDENKAVKILSDQDWTTNQPIELFVDTGISYTDKYFFQRSTKGKEASSIAKKTQIQHFYHNITDVLVLLAYHVQN